MKRCDDALKQKWILLQNNEVTQPIVHYEFETPYKNDVMLDKNINMLMREIDSQEHKMQAIKNIFLNKWAWVNRDA